MRKACIWTFTGYWSRTPLRSELSLSQYCVSRWTLPNSSFTQKNNPSGSVWFAKSMKSDRKQPGQPLYICTIEKQM